MDEEVHEEFMSLRSLGIGVNSSILFELIEKRDPDFVNQMAYTRWNWFTRFTNKYNLTMRRPSPGISSTVENEQAEIDAFIQNVKEKIISLQVGM
jgi:hypothetical protein